jgi:hypothetical protein
MYTSFNSSRMMLALCPLGVPKVNSSMPLVVLGPVGFSSWDMMKVALKAGLAEAEKCLVVWKSLLSVAGVNMGL